MAQQISYKGKPGYMPVKVAVEGQLNKAIRHMKVDDGSSDSSVSLTGVDAMDMKQMDAVSLTESILNGARNAGLDTEQVQSAIELASYAHRDATRPGPANTPRAPYIEHPLRNTERLMRFGCTDQATLIASILHDTIEDNAEEIAEQYAGVTPTSKEHARTTALSYVQEQYGEGVANIVHAVSNEISAPDATTAEKHIAYRAHVAAGIADVRVLLVKFADYADNAFSLDDLVSPENTEKEIAKVTKLATKYRPLVDVFEDRLNRPDVDELITVEGKARMTEALNAGRKSMQRITSEL